MIRFIKFVLMLLLLASIVVTSTSCHHTFEFFSTMKFYEGEKIKYIYEASGFESYAIVCDKKVYISCMELDNAPNSGFLYAEFFAPSIYGTFAPILIFEGDVQAIDYYRDNIALIRTEQNELYSFHMTKKWRLAEKIADNVIQSAHSNSNYAFYVTSDHNLYAQKCGSGSKESELKEKFKISDEGSTLLYTGVKSVKLYRNDRLFVLTTDDKLCELVWDAEGSAVLTDPLLENVNKFEVLDTSHRYIDGSFHYSTEEGGKTPLFHVLLNDGSLYVKGIYNTIYYGRFGSYFPMEQYDEWTLIDNAVSDFSSSKLGVLYLTNKGEAIYRGFDTVYDKDNFLFDKKILLESGAVSVSAGKSSRAIYVFGSDDKIYCWGDKFTVVFNRIAMENISVFHDEPLVFENK